MNNQTNFNESSVNAVFDFYFENIPKLAELESAYQNKKSHLGGAAGLYFIMKQEGLTTKELKEILKHIGRWNYYKSAFKELTSLETLNHD